MEVGSRALEEFGYMPEVKDIVVLRTGGISHSFGDDKLLDSAVKKWSKT